MPSKDRPERRRAHVPQSPLCELMPGGRIRINPSDCRQLFAWLYAATQHYRRVSRFTLTGTSGKERDARRALIRWARIMMQCVSHLNGAMLDTVPADAYFEAMEEWDRNVNAVAQGQLFHLEQGECDPNAPMGDE